MKLIPKYSMGIGDRFAHQGKAQLSAFTEAERLGLSVTPVWNKSNREHTIIHSDPCSVRKEANEAVLALGWKGSYCVDADHIGLATVDRFIEASDFYTIDVADFTGKPAAEREIEAFVGSMARYSGALAIPGIAKPFDLTEDVLRQAAEKFLLAIQEAGRIYWHIANRKGAENFVTEISIDETDTPQSPVDLFLILAMIAQQKIPVQTIAPKFTGRFNKGIDYVGDLARFEKEFDEDLCVITFSTQELRLPKVLKLSVHSGSDKFSLYPIINRQIKRRGAGLHLKTAGTTWLEEVIGLAEAGGSGLEIAKDIYSGAYARFDELTAPYSTVIDIERSELPEPSCLAKWDSERFVNALRHVPSNPDYNRHLRQLIHVGFKVAAEMGHRYIAALEANEEIIGRNVSTNILDRHIKPIFA
jgi:hypothetical protein